MKLVFAIIVILNTGFSLVDAAEPDGATVAKIEAQTREFLQALTTGRIDDARKHLFKVTDDPSLQPGDALAKNLEAGLVRLAEHFNVPGHDPKLQKIKALKSHEKLDRTILPVEFWAFDPGEDELEQGDFAWILTQNSGWRIIEL